MHVGVTLPSFGGDVGPALEAARAAEDAGLDGVFVFDHLWPLDRPDRPALSAFPLLGAVAAVTDRVALGPLVARVGLVPDGTLVAGLLSLARLAPGRLVAGLGTGDERSEAENRAFGVAYEPADSRRLALARCALALRQRGLRVWIGGGSPATDEVAFELGVALNLWGAQPAALGALRARGEVTWAGPAPGEVPALERWLTELAAAGASWAVCAWPGSVDALAEAAALVR